MYYIPSRRSSIADSPNLAKPPPNRHPLHIPGSRPANSTLAFTPRPCFGCQVRPQRHPVHAVPARYLQCPSYLPCFKFKTLLCFGFTPVHLGVQDLLTEAATPIRASPRESAPERTHTEPDSHVPRAPAGWARARCTACRGDASTGSVPCAWHRAARIHMGERQRACVTRTNTDTSGCLLAPHAHARFDFQAPRSPAA